MQSRWTTIGIRHCGISRRRRPRATSSSSAIINRRRWFARTDAATSLFRAAAVPRVENIHSAVTCYRRSIHTNPFSSYSSAAADYNHLLHRDDDDDDIDSDPYRAAASEREIYGDDNDEDVKLFSQACLSRLLGEHLVETYQEDDLSHPSSLEYELGEASIWDVQEEPLAAGYEDDVDDDEYPLVDEETLKEENPQRVTSRQAPKRSAHDMLLRFHPNSPPPDNLEDLQLWLECESQRESVFKYRDVIDSARSRKDYSSMGMVQRQIREWYEPVKHAIENEQRSYFSKSSKKKDRNKFGPFLCLLQPQKLAVIATHEALMHTLLYPADGVPIASLCVRIGDAVEAEVNVQRLLQRQVLETKEREGEHDDVDTTAAADSATSIENLMDAWMYGPSHLQRYLDEAHQKDGKKRNRVQNVKYANRRAQKLLLDSEPWSDRIKLKVGVALIEILLDVATIQVDGKEENAFSYEKRWHRFRRQSGHVMLHDRLVKMIVDDTFDSLEASTMRYKPMILPPRDWVAPDDGGYSWLKIDFMRTHGSNTQRAALKEADLSTIFDGLNVLGRVPWVINKKILEVGERCWNENIPLGDIPSRTDYNVPPMPTKPDAKKILGLDKDSEAYKEARHEYGLYREEVLKHRRVHQKNMDLRSLRCSAILKLDQARTFQDHEIYFPYNIDFRGRAYPVPPHLSNVGSDLCRGMLKFADAKPLGKRGLYWLKVHLANLAGNDKLTFEGRAQFTDENMDNVRAAVNDPFGENRWWMALDDPFQGLATCHEIVNAIDSGDPESYRCSLPVHMDGSCNGLQHYAALGLDPVGGKAVNLCNTDRPQDVYIGVMHEVIRRVAEEAAVDLSFDSTDPNDLTRGEKAALRRNRAAKLVNGYIDRGVVKRTVMTSVYGVTFIGARNQIQEKIEEKLEEAGYDIDEIEPEIHQACGYLASLTMEVMGELFQGARQTMNWLTACARLIAQQGQPVAFVSPLGVPVIQPYRRSKPYTVVTLLQSVVLMDWSDDLPIHKQRQVTAFPPNYVHSLDSAHMILTALEMDRRGLHFSAVHDSFWTHPCDVDEMNEALRDCFVQLYEQPLLETLKETWELRYPSIEFPDLPERGTLDLNEVRKAKYFFQ